jgi:formate dehydrogenase subunit delta
MDMNNLINMENKIGQFFESQPDRDQALMAIAAHIRNFWDPRMRLQPIEYIDKNKEELPTPIVLAAIQRHRNDLQPRPLNVILKRRVAITMQS